MTNNDNSPLSGRSQGEPFLTPPGRAGNQKPAPVPPAPPPPPPPQPATSTSSFKPTKPKMGGVEQTDATTWCVWTGGKPLAGWTGLATPNPTSKTPEQYRATSMTSQAKSRHYRIEGLTPKFSRKDDFRQFQRKFMSQDKMFRTKTYVHTEVQQCQSSRN